MPKSQTIEYDIALSFAGEDRQVVDKIARLLRSRKVKVFYDKFEQTKLWGEDLYEHLANLYSNKARYCVMFLSSHYAQKAWTNHERKSAQARAFREQKAYILPVKLDDTEIPGIRGTVGYIDLRSTTIEALVDLIQEKLGRDAKTVSKRVKSVNPRTSKNLISVPGEDEIPMPNIRKKFTQLDKDKFLRNAFSVIKNYFKRALSL